VTAVLSLTEAPDDPHNTARGTYRTGPGGVPEPAPAPRFSATPAPEPTAAVPVGADTDRVLAGLGLPAGEIAVLREKGIVG
jgi:alpha-methylacyl-CoA racemase